ncbi:MAG: ferredoxin family protein [Candidatus Bathyarchaeota archaeon]|nr:ferredoxin family protein [Candidatus Bathyarchaeota archaeon]MDH5754589.1 ferredoxin family protein [Candidatus Bathyarchaeota archaeon]
MSSATYLGIPREQIQWYPIIDLSKCPGCKLCIEVCEGAGHDVYEFDGSSKKPIVAKPTHCLVGCKACGRVCPTKAITFPSRDELKQMLRDLRKKYTLK